MNADWPMPQAVSHYRPAKRSPQPWSPADRKILADLWTQKKPQLTAEQIGEIIGGRSKEQVYAKVYQMGLPPRRRRNRTMREKAEAFETARTGRKGDRSGLRRFHGVENSSGPKVVLEPWDPRYRAGTTVFPTTVLPAGRLPRLLKSGHNSRKIGAKVAKGRLRGAPIFTLTLEERATCPRSCPVWASCYGNNMPFAHRIHDDGTLTRRLWGELASIAAEHPQFLVRLHVLGDFYSTDYVRFWHQALVDFQGLNIFGFTARIPPDPIGNAVAHMAAEFGERCRIRFSGAGHETDCAEVIDRKEDATGIPCPAESDPDRCCASCALCWHTNRTISFLRH